MTVEISRSVIDAVLAEARAAPDREICGLLFGSLERIDAHRGCRNVADSPRDTFEIDPAALIAAFRAERGGGRGIAGCYHSHPTGDATPSPRDAAAAMPNGWLWLIVNDRDVRGFRAVAAGPIHGRFAPAAFAVTPDA